MQIQRYVKALAIALPLAMMGSAHAQTAKAPDPVAGTTWEYQTYDMWSNKLTSRTSTKVLGVSGEFMRLQYETTNVGGSQYEIVKPTVTEGTSRSDWNSVVMFRGEKADKIIYSWPMQPGKRWNYTVKADVGAAGSATPQVMTTRTDAEVQGWETVEVPAGKFSALKIVYKTTWSTDTPASSGSSTTTTWYSPDARASVKSTVENFGADGMPQARTLRQLSMLKTDSK